MATQNLEAQNSDANDRATLEALGGKVREIAAVLQAAIDTGAGEEEEEAVLISLAHTLALEARKSFSIWERS